MRDQTLRTRAKEGAKMVLRRALLPMNISIGRDPFSSRIARTLSSLDVDTVMDVGANVGQYSSSLRWAGFRGQIISCEPLPEAATLLRRRAASDGAWVVEETAIGAEIGRATINVTSDSYSSSLLTPTSTQLSAAPDARVLGQQAVAMTSVDELFRQYALAPERTLVKIDTQGYESEVLEGAAKSLPCLAALQVELSTTELYRGQVLYEDLMGTIMSHGFRLHSVEPGHSDSTGRLLQLDGLFVRDRH